MRVRIRILDPHLKKIDPDPDPNSTWVLRVKIFFNCFWCTGLFVYFAGVESEEVTNNILKFYCKSNGVLYENSLIQVLLVIHSFINLVILSFINLVIHSIIYSLILLVIYLVSLSVIYLVIHPVILLVIYLVIHLVILKSFILSSIPPFI